jgi:hypothetical protein
MPSATTAGVRATNATRSQSSASSGVARNASASGGMNGLGGALASVLRDDVRSDDRDEATEDQQLIANFAEQHRSDSCRRQQQYEWFRGGLEDHPPDPWPMACFQDVRTRDRSSPLHIVSLESADGIDVK